MDLLSFAGRDLVCIEFYGRGYYSLLNNIQIGTLTSKSDWQVYGGVRGIIHIEMAHNYMAV